MIPPDLDAEFVYHMERVLNHYHEPYDPDRPVVCFDESHKLLRGHEVEHHYDRNGRQDFFMITEPLAGLRRVEITDQRETEDWIDWMQQIADEDHPDADCIRMVFDNLNTHKPEALYEFLPPDELVSISIASSSTSRQSMGAG